LVVMFVRARCWAWVRGARRC